ncbi:MaoC/PaaZ C-terminal domain-containing protein [Sphingobium sp.]|uniref:MaoC/PaaZ C-terminal domain-containing protein n=1 Tax=Sphingobium sp. TaxID=1912891 RepID=UPI003B3BE400
MNLDAVVNRPFPLVRQAYGARDTILYALGVGAGRDPMATAELPFLYEKQLRILPSQASTLCYPGAWLAEPGLGIDYARIVHGEQAMTFHRPLHPVGEVIAEHEILCIDDRGDQRGAFIHFEKRLFDADDGAPICSVRSVYACRGDGGCGSWGGAPAGAQPMPQREADHVLDIETAAGQALIYRLSGDYNPLHIDPAVAVRAGFERPILHGLSTFGAACLALTQTLCAGVPERMTALSARFSQPVYPGDILRVELFVDGADVRFRATSRDRGVVVLDRGGAQIALPATIADAPGHSPAISAMAGAA